MLLLGLVLEDLEDRLAAETEEVQPAHHGVVRDAEVLAHPVVVVGERAERVHVLAAQHVDEERRRLVQVGTVTPMWSTPVTPGRGRSAGHERLVCM